MANVSHSTVSRALQNSPLVNPQTAEKIHKLADEMGYRVSAVARSLATRRTRMIGLVVTSIADPFMADVVSGIEDAANAHGYSVVLAISHADPQREVAVVRSLEERRVDGVIVTASRVGGLYLPTLSRMHIPVVLLNNQHPGEYTPSVMIANQEASAEATRHLVRLGHRRIGYVGDRNGRQSDTERFAGYREALEEADIHFQPELVVHGDGKADGGMQAMDRLLSLAEPPTAVFCYNDMTALGAMRRIRIGGLHVPDDISLVGFDDLFITQYTEPPLTTVRQPKHQMGGLAMEVMIRLFEGSQSEHMIRVPGELVVR